MPITPRDVARKAALTAALLLIFLLLRRGLLVGALALKILGHPDALNGFKGPVERKTVVHAGIPIDVYTRRDSHEPFLIIHGVNPTGKDSLDLIRISEALTQAGYQVFVPDLAEMKKLHLEPEEVSRIKSVFQYIGKDAAIACFSYGCGPALIAAADPEIRDRVHFALAFGGYFDARESLEFIVTGPETPMAWFKWAYLEMNSDVLQNEPDREHLRMIAEHHRNNNTPANGDLIEKLSPEGRALLDIFHTPTSEDFRARLNAAPEKVKIRLDALSPSRFITGLRAPLILIHGANDPVIPSEQTVKLAKAAKAHGLDCDVTLFRMYGHVNPILPRIGFRSVFGFYLPEVVRMLRVVNRLVP